MALEECGVYEDITDRTSVYIYFCGMAGSPNVIEGASESTMAPSVFNRTPCLRKIRLAWRKYNKRLVKSELERKDVGSIVVRSPTVHKSRASIDIASQGFP
jgi:hypothetical protein